MDFGLVGLEYFLGAENGIPSSQVYSGPYESKQKSRGSGFDEQQRSAIAEEVWRSSKMAKADDMSASKTMSLHQGVAQLRSNRQQEHMLSFSSPVSQVPFQRNNSQSSSFSYYQRMFPPDCNRNTAGISFTRFGVYLLVSQTHNVNV